MIGSGFVKKRTKRKNQSFLKGAITLTISMTIGKIIGALFKVPLATILGGEGNGYFLAAYELYIPLYALATAGFPIAISRMVSENVAKGRFKDVRQIHRVSIPIFLITGSIGLLIMVAATPIYVNYIKAPLGKYAMLALAPTLLFSCLMSIYRGYYEGLRNMIPTAISDIIEAVSKLVIGLSLAYAVVKFGMNEYYTKGTVFGKVYETESLAKSATLPFAAAGAILGITIGSVIAYLYLLIDHKLKGDGITNEELTSSPAASSGRETSKNLIKIAIPIGLGAVIMNVASFIDVTLIMKRLDHIMQNTPQLLLNNYKGLINPEIVERGNVHVFLYGCYGCALTIMMLIPAVTQAFSISALPSVTTAWSSGEYKKIKNSIESVLKITTLVTIPAGLGIMVLSYPIMNLAYGSGGTHSEVLIASNVLVLLGVAGIFMSTSTPICSMLQAIGRVDLPVKLLSIGVLMKIGLNYLLVGIPEINIQGAGAGTLVCYAFVTISAMYCLCKETKIVPDLNMVLIKPLLASITCAAGAYVSYSVFSRFISSKLSTMISIIIAVIIYVISLFLFKAITSNDIKMIVKSKKIVKTLEKCGLIS